MKTTIPKLRRTVRYVIKESMAQSDVLYLENLLMAYKGTFGDWSEFCSWYNELMMELRVQYDEEMDDFLYSHDLEECPENIQDLLYMINRPETQAHPLFSTWANSLRNNF